MEKVSNLLGKPILNIFEGKIEGFVKTIYFDKKLDKLCWIEFFNDTTQEEKMINAKNIYHVGQDAITIKNGDEIYNENLIFNECINPIHLDVFSVIGDKIGKVCDIQINDKFMVEQVVLSDQKTMSQKNILNAGNVIIFKQENENFKVINFKSKNKIKNIKSQTKVQILNTNNNPLPKKLITKNYAFLIGRKVDKNIYADNSELIIKKNTKINQMIIDIACKNGKLKDLASNSIAE